VKIPEKLVVPDSPKIEENYIYDVFDTPDSRNLKTFQKQLDLSYISETNPIVL
jgi:hypothetical protein